MTPSTGHPKRGVVAVIAREGQLLVIRRSQLVVAPGAYCFPGGGVADGESEEAAVVREMQEELGVDAKPVRRLWQSVTPWGVELDWWMVELHADAILLPNVEEVAEVEWLQPAEIRELDGLLESNHHFFEAWDRGELSLSLD